MLLEVNEALQRRCRAVLELRNKGRPGLGAGMSRLEGADARYRCGPGMRVLCAQQATHAHVLTACMHAPRSALKQWSDLREERERVTAHYQVRRLLPRRWYCLLAAVPCARQPDRTHTLCQVTVFEMKAALEGRIKRADEIAATFSRFKWEVALAAQHTKTGQPVSAKAVEALEARGECRARRSSDAHASAAISIRCHRPSGNVSAAYACADRTVEEEVQRVRLKNIHLCNVLKKLEATIRCAV